MVPLTVAETPASVSVVSEKVSHLRVSAEPEILEDLGRIRMPRRDVANVDLEIVDAGRRVPRVSLEDE